MSAVEIYRAEHGFHGVGNEGGAFSSPLGFLAAPHEEHFSQPEPAGKFRKLALAHQAGTQARHAAFPFLGKTLVDFMGNIDFQHGVAKKLQPFVVNGVVFVGPGTVGERRGQEGNIAEAVPEARFKFRKAFQRVGGKGRPLHDKTPRTGKK